MKTSHPSPLTIVNTCLLLLLIHLTMGNREVGKGNATRLDSQRVIIEMESTFQRRQARRLVDATVERWQNFYHDNPQIRAREMKASDLIVPEPTPGIDTPTPGR